MEYYSAAAISRSWRLSLVSYVGKMERGGWNACATTARNTVIQYDILYSSSCLVWVTYFP